MAQDKKKPNTTKRVPKTSVKFKITLNDEQKEAKRLILENDVIVLFGKAGSGKTLVSCQAALDFYFTRRIETIRIARPTVAKEELGFLPGKIEEKLEPWLQPIYHNFYQCYDKKKIEEMLKEENIVISPLAYMRGITYLNECLISGEVVLTRRGWLKIEDVYDILERGEHVELLSYNTTTEKEEYNTLSMMKKTEVSEYIQIELEDGTITKVSKGHKFYTERGLIEAQFLLESDVIISMNIKE